jgi:hypothetical protein
MQRRRLRAIAAHLLPATAAAPPGGDEQRRGGIFNSLTHQYEAPDDGDDGPVTAAALGDELQPLRVSSDILDDTAALRERLAEDGYLFLPGFHEQGAVHAARTELLQYLQSRDDDPANPVFKPGTYLNDAVFGGRAVTFAGHRDWPGVGGDQRGVRPNFLNVVNAPKLMDFFSSILGGASTTFDHKWLRVVPPGNGNSAHCDIVYMSGGAQELYTVWTPLGDVPLEMGPLAVLTCVCQPYKPHSPS